jgi:Holliday junction resolvase RusA-like endonuclease
VAVKKRLARKRVRVPVLSEVRWEGGELVVVLPLPAGKLHPNGTRNRMERHRLTAERRDAVCALVRTAGRREPMERAETEAVFYYATDRRRDSDGAASWLKATWDGIADAGVVVNDSGLRHLPPRMDIDRVRPRVELRIREISEEV